MNTIVPAGIDLKYLQSSSKKFIKNYESTLLNFVGHLDSVKYIDYVETQGWHAPKVQDEWNSIPNNQLELKFIKTLLSFIKERNEELIAINLVPLNEHFKRKEFLEQGEEKNKELISNSLTLERKNDKLRKETRKEFNEYSTKKAFLISKAQKLGYQVFLDKEIIFSKINEEEDTVIELSNTKATEKLIYLKETGIIDHLRNQEPFKRSINKLATVLSAITDEKASTLQPKLNAMLSEHTNAPQNDPYRSKNKVDQIKQSLIILGLKAND